MDINSQIREGLRFLTGVEEGNLSSSDAYNIISSLDPVLISLSIKYLRKKYPPTRQESAGIMGRLVELSGTYPKVVQWVKDGDEDPISEWFHDTYSLKDFFSDPEEFIDLIVNKLEG